MKIKLYIITFVIISIIASSILISLPNDPISEFKIDAEIILPTYSQPSIYTTPMIKDPISVIDPFDNLTAFIQNDSTNNHKYIKGEYMCMDFSIDLATNLTENGYESGVVLISQHALVWVTMPSPYNTLYIEPILDEIYNPFNNNTKEITIEQAQQSLNDMHRFGYYN